MILVGADVGGTFTDIILANTNERTFAIHKVPTTAPDPSVGMVEGIKELCAREGVSLAQVDHMFHGTTIATNATLEHKGARTGMITTRGYRDIIHIGRHQRPQNYSLRQDIPWQSRPFVRRRHRKVVTERLIPPLGEVLTPLDEAEAREQIRALQHEGVESIAVCFLFSYLNPAHENRVQQLIEEEFPGVFVTTSADVSPQFREFERFTTACLNAFLGPKVKGYIDELSHRLEEAGARTELHIMTSNGGVTTAHHLDIGALVPGSCGIVDAVDAYAEGLQFKAIKVYERGIKNQPFWNFLADNVRAAEMVVGDMEAQIAACRIGAERYVDLVERYGIDTVLAASEYLMNYSEAMLRQEIARLPDGTYSAEGFFDGYLDSPDPAKKDLKIAVTLTIKSALTPALSRCCAGEGVVE